MNRCTKLSLYIKYLYTKYFILNFFNSEKNRKSKLYKNHKVIHYSYLNNNYTVFINVKRKPNNIYKINSIINNNLVDITDKFYEYCGPNLNFNNMKVSPSFFGWGDIIITFYNESKISIKKHDYIDTSLII